MKQNYKEKNDLIYNICLGFKITRKMSISTLKNLVSHSQNFLLPYSTVKEYFVNGITFIFILFFICFVGDEKVAFIITVKIFLT